MHDARGADPGLEPGVERDIPGLHLEGFRLHRLVTLGLDPQGHGCDEGVRELDLVRPATKVGRWTSTLPVDVEKGPVPVEIAVVIAMHHREPLDRPPRRGVGDLAPDAERRIHRHDHLALLGLELALAEHGVTGPGQGQAAPVRPGRNPR